MPTGVGVVKDGVATLVISLIIGALILLGGVVGYKNAPVKVMPCPKVETQPSILQQCITTCKGQYYFVDKQNLRGPTVCRCLDEYTNIRLTNE